MSEEATTTYRTLDSVVIPEDVPELVVRAGDTGVISHIYNDPERGRMLDVEIPREGGTSAGFVDLEVSADGSLRVAGFSPLSS